MYTSMPDFAEVPFSILNEVTAEDRKQFCALWPEHLKLRDNGVVAFFIPQTMARRMNGKQGMMEIADNLCKLRNVDSYIYFDVDNAAYRIGDYVKPCDQYLYVDKVKLGDVIIRKSTPQVKPAAARIRKPANMWILYRQDKWAEFKAHQPRIHTSAFSKIVSQMWRNESPAVKFKYEELAARLKEQHLKAHPNYKCVPRKPSEIQRRNMKRKQSLLVHPTTPTPEEMSSEAVDDTDTVGEDEIYGETGIQSGVESDVESGVESDNDSDTDSDNGSDNESEDERPPFDLNNPKARAIIERCRKDWKEYFG
ncbi:HMG box protein [Phlyctema vagabunda]|uniref:HMG box protein n=1 Tax=Phlyctema vagabunda TaxID=108571 RepID=A0ABR4PA25_9HELO